MPSITSDISTMKLFDIGKVNLTNRNNLSTIYINNNNRDNNDIDNSIDAIRASVGIIPEIYIWGFLATILTIGIILNILAIYTLLRAKCHGTRYFLLQLTFCDCGSLFICILELFYINYQKWFMPPELCQIYLGFESFFSTATIYLIIGINLHAISTYHLAIKTLQQKTITESDEYDPLTTSASNQQSLNNTTINNADNDDNDNYEIAISTPTIIHQSTRSLTIDYSKKKIRISVIKPILLIWLIAISSAIPLLIFGQVIPNDMNPKLCGIMNFDWYSIYIMQGFMLIIRIAIPILCLLITLIILITKLNNIQKERIIKSGILDENVKNILKLGIALTLIILIFNLQKLIFSLLFELITKPFMHYRYPLMNPLFGIFLSAWSFLAPVIRPIVYYTMDKELKSIFCNKKRKKKKKKFHKNEIF